jgi:DNA polymerase III delta subunit
MSKMLKLIHGKNTSITKKTLKEVRDSFKNKKIIEIDLEESGGLILLVNELRIEGLFGGKDLIIVKNFFSCETDVDIDKKTIISLIKKYIGDIYFFEMTEVKKVDFKSFERIDGFVEVKNILFDFVKERGKIERFLLEYVKEKGYTIDRVVLSSLITGYKEINAILNEIDKLGIYDKNITKESFDKLSVIPFESNLFKLVEAMALKNKKLSHYLLEKEYVKGTPFQVLFGTVVYQFRNLLIVKEACLKGGRNPGLNSFVFNKSKNIVRNINIKEIRSMYFSLFKYDELIKKGKILPLPALECFVNDLKVK